MKYEINGRIIETEGPLTEEQIDAIASDMRTLYGGVDPDVPTTENLTTPPAPFPEAGKPTLGQQAVQELPTITGGGLGMVGMATGGPPLAMGMAGAGGVAGGMLRDILQGKPFDATNLISEGLMQAAFEGGGSLAVDVGGKIVRYTPDVLRAFNITQGADPMQAASQLMRSGAPTAGTIESKRSTQEILQAGVPSAVPGEQVTATLSRGQTGQAGPMARLFESLGAIGLLGQGVFQRNAEQIDTILQTNLNNILEGLSGRVRSTSEIGESFIDTINTAKRALSDNYGAELTNIQQAFRSGYVNTASLKARVQGLLKSAARASDTGKPTLLEEATVAEMRSILDLPDSVSGDALLGVLKRLSGRSSALLEKGTTGYNSVASAEITDFLTNTFRPFVDKQLKAIDSEAFGRYQTLNSNYANSTAALTPSLLKAAAKRGQQENFSGVGALLVETNNPEYVKKAFKALQEAKKVNKDLNVLDSMDALRQGYLLKLVGGESRDLSQLVKAAEKLKANPKQQEVFDEVLGASAPGVQKLLNAAFDASQGDSVGALSLMLRGQESQSLRTIVQAGGAGFVGAGGSFTDLTLAAAVLGTPRLFAKMALKPSAVNKLLQLDKASRNMKPKMIASNLGRIANEAGIDLEKEIESYLRQLTEGQQAAQEVQQAVGQ